MCPTKVNFDWSNGEIGWKMANGRRGYVYIDYSTFYDDLFFHVLYITFCITLSITTRQSEECSSTQ